MDCTVQWTISNDELHKLGFLSRDQMAKAISSALDQVKNSEGRQVDLGHVVKVLPDW